MNISKLLKNDYYLNSSVSFFKDNFEKRLKFIQNKKFLFSEISNFINNCIDSSKSIFIFCAGNSLISKNILRKDKNKIYVTEFVTNPKFLVTSNDDILRNMLHDTLIIIVNMFNPD